MDDFTAAMILDGEWDLAGLEPSEENFILAAQHLVNTGLAWQLQGRVGRTCAHLIATGLVMPMQGSVH